MGSCLKKSTVSRADYIEIRFGHAPWMMWAHVVITLLGILAVLISPASWQWKVCLVLTGGCASLLLARKMSAMHNTGIVRILPDSTAFYATAIEKRIFTILCHQQWVCRWFCSLAVSLAHDGKRKDLIICASKNSPDEYRRLLKFLRMRSPAPESQRMIW